MNPRQLLSILRLRWLLVVVVTIVVGIAGTIYTLRLPKVYTSSTSLLLDVKTDPLVSTFMPAIASPAFLATQSHIIRSDRVAHAVVKRLGLTQSKDAVSRWRKETSGKIPLDIYYASMMQRGLVVEPAPGTSVLNIAYTASDPDFAAAVANAYAQSYIDFSVDLRVEPARQYANWFDERLKDLRNKLESSKAKLGDAQRATGIVSTDNRMDEELNKLSTLQAQLATAMAEQTDLSVKSRNSGRDTSVDVQQSSAVQGLKGQLSSLEAKFAEIKGKYGESHPEYQQTETQINAVRQQLAAEIRRVSGTSYAAQAGAEQKVADLRSQVEAQKKRLFNLRISKDDVDILARDVDSNQRAYDAVMQRRSQLSLESQSDQANARVLSTAVPPLGPSKPKVPLNIAMAIVAGLGLGAALACGLEFLDRRIRSVDDLKAMEDLPVLVVLSPSEPKSVGFARPLLASAKNMLPQLGR